MVDSLEKQVAEAWGKPPSVDSHGVTFDMPSLANAPAYKAPARGQNSLEDQVASAYRVSSSPFTGHPLENINPSFLTPDDFTRDRTRTYSGIPEILKPGLNLDTSPASVPMTLEDLRAERQTLDPKQAAKRAERGAMQLPHDWRTDNSQAGLNQREGFADLQFRLAVHQYEKTFKKDIPQKDFIAYRDYYREQAGLGGPHQYADDRKWQEAEANRPEEVGPWQSFVRKTRRFTTETASAIGGGIEMLGSLAGSVGMDKSEAAAKAYNYNIKYSAGRQLRRPELMASRQANQLWNPSSLDWWADTLTGKGMQMMLPIKGKLPGAILMGGMESGDVYERIIEGGGDPHQAAHIAGIYMGVATICEHVGAKIITQDITATSKLCAALSRSLYRGGMEAAEEGAAVIAEWTGTEKMPAHVFQRIGREAMMAGLVGSVSSLRSPLTYRDGGGQGVRPKMATDYTDVSVGRDQTIRVQATTDAAGLPEAIRTDPKAMRVKIHSVLRNALGDKQKAVEVQRQIAYDLYGKNAFEKQPWEMTQTEFDSEYVFHGAPHKLDSIKKGSFFSDYEYAKQYAWKKGKSEGRVYAVRKSDLSPIDAESLDISGQAEIDTGGSIRSSQSHIGIEMPSAGHKGFTRRTRLFTLRDINDPDQLAEIYNQARLYQPIGLPKVIDDPGLNSSLERLTQRMNQEQTLTDDEFHGILTNLGLRGKGGPKAHMTRSQAFQLRRHLKAQGKIGGADVTMAIRRSQNPAIDRVLLHHEKSAESYRQKRRAKGQKTMGGLRDFQSTRHRAAHLDDATGKPFRWAFDEVIARTHEAAYGEARWFKELFNTHRKAKKILARTGKDADVIRQAIDSGKMEKLSEPERAVAEAIRQKLQEAEIEVKIRELSDYLDGRADPSSKIDQAILDRAEREFDERGYSALYDVASTEDFGTRKAYYPKYRNSEKRTIYQELSRYYKNNHAANMINPDLNVYNVLIEQVTKQRVPDARDTLGGIANPNAMRRQDVPFAKSRDLKDPDNIVSGAIAFTKAVRGIDPTPSKAGRAFQYIANKALTAHYFKQEASGRNALQIISEDNNLTADRAFKLMQKLSPEDQAFVDVYALQMRGVQEQMGVHQGPLNQTPGIHIYQVGVRAATNTYPAVDAMNRLGSMKLSLARTREAIREAGPNWKDTERGIYQVIRRSGAKARFDDVTIRRAVEELATKGEDGFARYIALQHTLDVQGSYLLAERSIEEIRIGKPWRQLATWTRLKAETYGRAMHTLTSRRSTPAARDQAAVVILHMALKNMAAGMIFMGVTGRGRNPYNIWEALTFLPGAFPIELLGRAGNAIGMAAKAMWEGDWGQALRAGEVIPNTFLAGYASIKRIWEATEIGGPPKIRRGGRLYQAPEPSILGKMQHVLTGKRYDTLVDERRPKKRKALEKREKRPIYLPPPE